MQKPKIYWNNYMKWFYLAQPFIEEITLELHNAYMDLRNLAERNGHNGPEIFKDSMVQNEIKKMHQLLEIEISDNWGKIEVEILKLTALEMSELAINYVDIKDNTGSDVIRINDKNKSDNGLSADFIAIDEAMHLNKPNMESTKQELIKPEYDAGEDKQYLVGIIRTAFGNDLSEIVLSNENTNKLEDLSANWFRTGNAQFAFKASTIRNLFNNIKAHDVMFNNIMEQNRK